MIFVIEKYVHIQFHVKNRSTSKFGSDGYYMAYKPIIVLYILFMFVEMKFIYYHLITCILYMNLHDY